MVAIGDYNSMKVFCSLYNNIEYYCRDKNKQLHSESLLMFHLNENNINIKEFIFNFDLNKNRRQFQI
jgi:hypothetical protein